LLFSFTEYQFRLNSNSRLVLFVLFVFVSGYIIAKYIAAPIFHLVISRKQISDEKAAELIGKFFPDIQDKLLNIIQLNNISAKENSLIEASINQKSANLGFYNFSQSISIKKSNKRFFPYVLVSCLLLFVILLFAPYMVTEGSYRILKFNEEFVPKAPFDFILENRDLQIFENESFTVNLSLKGNQIPQEVFIYKNDVKYKMEAKDGHQFSFSFNKLRNDLDFRFQAAGFYSQQYQVNVVEKPIITNLTIELDYPNYTQLDNQRIFNNGDILVPEGTSIKWLINSSGTDNILLQANDTAINFKKEKDDYFSYSSTVLNNFNYSLGLKNRFTDNQKSKTYAVEVINDDYPEISLQSFNDSTFYNTILVSGQVSDDYGIRALKLFYEIKENNEIIRKGNKTIDVSRGALNQKYFLQWSLDSLLTDNDQYVEYYTKAWDNDAVNGSKSASSDLKIFKLPSQKEVKESIAKTSQQTENQIDKSISSTEDVNKKLEELDKILKTKKQLSFEDKKLLEDILKESAQVEETIESIKEKLAENAQKRKQFDETTESLDQKSEQLQELMDEMLKDKDDDLLKKIEELLQQKQSDADDFRESASELQKREKNRLKEMARLMELFKRLEVEYDLNEIKNELEKVAEEQEQLANKNKESTEQKTNQSENTNKELEEEQRTLNDSFEDIKKELDDLKDKNQQLKQPNQIEDTKDTENDIDQSQQESLEQLQNQQNKDAQQSQQKASDKMKEMAQQMQQMQNSMSGGGQQMQEDMDNIRDIVDNLLKLSYRQEELMKAFRAVDPSDPRFISLSEEQLTIKDDAVIIEDSLTSLANRVFQLKSFITKEMTEMNSTIDKSIESLQVRDVNKSVGYQQFSMTSMNNLALLLDDILEQMQMQMKSNQSSGQQSKNQQQASPSQRQKALNQKTQELSQGQQQGRQFSEQLAELAAEQARIRKQMEEMQEERDGRGEKSGGDLSTLMEEMEEIEEDLVNKNINSQLIERQKKLVTKLLEAEKAQQQQEEDDKRKGETATDYEKNKIPAAFEKYLNEKRQEVEQLKSIPPALSPYYKNEVNKYFNRIKNNNLNIKL